MKINRTLGERIAAEKCPGNIPGFVQERSVAVKRDNRLEKRAQTVRENSGRPPEKMRAAAFKVTARDLIKKKRRKDGRQYRQVMDRLQCLEILVH